MYRKQSIEGILGTILDEDRVLLTPVLISVQVFQSKKKLNFIIPNLNAEKKTSMP